MNQKKTSSRKNQIRNGLRADKGATAEADGKTMLQNLLQGTIPNAHIEISQLPRLSGLRLGLINADFPTGPLPAEVMRTVIAQPAYWAFCWGSGLACAEWILANPALLRDKSVVDIGCGSGVVAIAAKLAGAAEVWACDNDQDALLATAANARLNSVDLSLSADLAELHAHFDFAFLADVLYDKSNLPLLDVVKPLAQETIVSDSRIRTLPDPNFTEFFTTQALTHPNLGEFDEFKTVRFFRYYRATS